MLCIPGQRRSPGLDTVTIMKPEEMTMAVVVAWALIWSVVAVSLVSSISNWIVVVGAGVLPPLMIQLMWHAPAGAVPALVRETGRSFRLFRR